MIEAFFAQYGEALAKGDLKSVSGCYDVPSFVLSDAGSISIASREEIEAAFEGAAEQYRSQGLVAARPNVVSFDVLTGQLHSVDVRWDYLDGGGNSVQQDAYRYILRLNEAEEPQICVVVATATG